MPRYLDTAALRRFYDRFAARQDAQAFYEDAAFYDMKAHADLKMGHRVFEFGCGTGRMAERLLANAEGQPSERLRCARASTNRLPADVHYAACDISATMIALARKRLARFGDRVALWQSDGGFDFSRGGPPFDRVFVAYVLDLLPPERIAAFLDAAHASLRAGGLLCAIALTRGDSLASALVSGAWSAVHRLTPALVGGCRPLQLAPMLDPGRWHLRHHALVRSWAIPSEVVVAMRQGEAQ